MREIGFTGTVMRERKQADHCAAGLLLALLDQQHLECAGVSAAREQLIAIDQIEQRHRFFAQRVDDVMIVDDVTVLSVPLRRPTTPPLPRRPRISWIQGSRNRALEAGSLAARPRSTERPAVGCTVAPRTRRADFSGFLLL